MPTIKSSTRDAGSWHLFVDGSAWPNPGKMGLGVILTSPEGKTQQYSIPLNASGCNNEAELRALHHGLETAKQAGALMLVIASDSDFAVRHSRGEMKTRTAHLQALIDQVRQLMAGFPHVELTWVPRHRNGPADNLARKALGLATKPALVPRALSTARRRRK